jgi:hypothetical protein
MCLTLANAAAIHHHTDPTSSSALGYTASSHHSGHLTPGDQWRPVLDQRPRTVTDIHRRHGVIALTDQYGSTWTYPATSVIPTAVPDPLHLHTSTRGDGGTPMTTNASHSAPVTGHHARRHPDDPARSGRGVRSH